MQNDKKYVPPALRRAGIPEVKEARDDYVQEGYGGGRDGGYQPQAVNYNTNQRWQEDQRPSYNNYRGNSYGGPGGGGGGRFSGRGYYQRDGPSGRDGGYSFSRVNELGFHGDMRANPRVEDELFFKNETQTAGINFDNYDNIPVEVSSGCPDPYNEFTPDTIGDQLMKNLALMKFTKPTPVQKYSIPIGLSGGDMMACAQTGSGKTAGFLFPLIAKMLRSGAREPPDGRRGKGSYITALVLAPTRELAVQIFEEAQKFCYCTGIRPVVVYGGANIQLQQRELDLGADILVATPGRLVDLIERGRVRLDVVQFLVLDEADRMLDMGFEPQIRRIVQEEGMPVDRQTFMFSATFPVEIQRLAGDFMRNYVFIAVGRVGAASKDVTQRIEWVEQNEKVQFVIDFLTRVPEGLVLVFVETKRGADNLEEVLVRYGFPASSIHGDKSQREREDALKLFKTGRTPILVATDVAARGLDIPNVTQVINFDMPSNIDDYVHRIGRTGRVGNVGHALSLMNDKNRNIAKDIIDVLVENQQEIPYFLERMVGGVSNRYQGRGGGGRGGGGRSGGHRFGARDYRRDYDNSGGRGRGSGGPPKPHGGYSKGPSSGFNPYDRSGGGGGGDHGHDNYADNSAW